MMGVVIGGAGTGMGTDGRVRANIAPMALGTTSAYTPGQRKKTCTPSFRSLAGAPLVSRPGRAARNREQHSSGQLTGTNAPPENISSNVPSYTPGTMVETSGKYGVDRSGMWADGLRRNDSRWLIHADSGAGLRWQPSGRASADAQRTRKRHATKSATPRDGDIAHVIVRSFNDGQ